MSNEKSRTTALVAAACAVGVLGLTVLLVLVWRANRALAAASVRRDAAVLSLSEDLARIKRTETADPVTVHALHLTGTAPATPGAAPQSDAQRAHFSKVMRDAQVQLLADTFAKEPADPAWSTGAETMMRTLYTASAFAALSTHVECKTTLCRVSFDYSDPKQGKAAVQHVIAEHPWPCRAFTRNDWNGHTGFSYVARQGAAFPRVDPKTLVL